MKKNQQEIPKLEDTFNRECLFGKDYKQSTDEQFATDVPRNITLEDGESLNNKSE